MSKDGFQRDWSGHCFTMNRTELLIKNTMKNNRAVEYITLLEMICGLASYVVCILLYCLSVYSVYCGNTISQSQIPVHANVFGE